MASHDPRIFQAVSIAKGLKFYALHKGMLFKGARVKDLMRTASNITGKEYKAREYMKAHDDLLAWAKEYADA